MVESISRIFSWNPCDFLFVVFLFLTTMCTFCARGRVWAPWQQMVTTTLLTSSLLQDIAVMDFCSVADGRPSGGYANTCSFWSGLKHCNVWPSILIPLPSWACHFARVSFQIMCKQKVEFPRFANDLYAFGIDLIRSCSSLTATVRSSKETDHRGSAIPAWTGSRLANAMC